MFVSLHARLTPSSFDLRPSGRGDGRARAFRTRSVGGRDDGRDGREVS